MKYSLFIPRGAEAGARRASRERRRAEYCAAVMPLLHEAWLKCCAVALVSWRAFGRASAPAAVNVRASRSIIKYSFRQLPIHSSLQHAIRACVKLIHRSHDRRSGYTGRSCARVLPGYPARLSQADRFSSGSASHKVEYGNMRRGRYNCSMLALPSMSDVVDRALVPVRELEAHVRTLDIEGNASIEQLYRPRRILPLFGFGDAATGREA